MSRAAWIAILSLIVVAAITARAEEDEALDAPTDADAASPEADKGADGSAGITGILAKAHFLSHDGVDLKVHAGESVNTLIGFANSDANQPMHVIFATAHLLYAGSAASNQVDGANYVMNFSGTMYTREVKPGEVATFNYQFTTDAQLDPRAYDLVLKVYFSTVGEGNSSYVANAFQGSILIEDPLGFDFQTYGTLAAIVGAAGYFGYRYNKKRQGRGRSAAAREMVELSSGVKYDPDFVSKEHLRYVEKSQSPKAKSQSPKPASPK